jgi:two-component system, sensor histidine kinase PdtaS
MRKSLCFLFCISCLCSLAQVDSLKKNLTKAKGRDRVTILHKLIAVDTATNVRLYYNEAINIATQFKDSEAEIKSYHTLGQYYLDRGNIDSASSYYTLGLQRAKEKKQTSLEVHALIHLALCCHAQLKFEQALPYLNDALAVSRKSKQDKDIAYVLQELGFYHYEERNYDIALLYFNEELIYDERLNDSIALAAAYNNIGAIHSNTGNYTKSVLSYKKALAIQLARNALKDVAVCETNIGIVYKEQGDYRLALDYLLKAARYYDGSNYRKEQASCYTTIGNIQIELGDYDKALGYHLQALELRKKINHQKGIAGSLTNIGKTYIKQKKYTLAIDFLNRSLQLKTALKDNQMIAASLDLLGEVYYLKKDFVLAKKHYLQSLELKERVKDAKGKAETYNNLGALYLAWNNYPSALDALANARKILLSTNAKTTLLHNYELTMLTLRAQGNYQNALEFYDRYKVLKDSLQNDNMNKALAELQIKYETEKKEQEIVSLNERDKVQAALLDRQHTMIYLLVIGAALLVITIGLLFYIGRSRKTALRQNQIIIKQKQTMIDQKQNLMRELHHRVKNNLQILSSILDLQKDRTQDKLTQDLIQAVSVRLNAMLLIHKNLYHDTLSSQIEMRVYIDALLENLIDTYGYRKSKLETHLAIDPILLDADSALSIGFICNEIISNTFKHAFPNAEKPTIHITLQASEENIHLSIIDNGKGFSNELKVDEHNSFGIRLIRLFAQDLSAKIDVQSSTTGTSFSLTIPNAYSTS